LLTRVTDVNHGDMYGNTPLHDAAAEDAVTSMDALFAHGANPYARNKFGRSPLHFAARAGSVRAVNWLLGHGANPLAADSEGRRPRSYAEERNYGDFRMAAAALRVAEAQAARKRHSTRGSERSHERPAGSR
jgi:ankyrin repeat protein